MLITTPHYYNQFRCIAGDCPDTCCAGWQIVIDDATRRKYENYKGPFGNRLHNSIHWKDSSFKQYERRCAFLSEDNLCDIYREAGKDMLCRTCRNYPRHIEEFEGSREISLSLSCVEAARLILGCKEPVHFLTREREGEEEYDDFDFFLYTKLEDARDLIIKILQNRQFSIEVRMGAVLALAHDLQRRINRQELFSVDELLERYQKEGALDKLEKKLGAYCITGEGRFLQMQELFGFFGELEVLKADWPEYLAARRSRLFEQGKEAYAGMRRRFLEQKTRQWDVFPEQLMVYFVFTYFCGAVYDERAYEKMKLAVVSTILIEELVMAGWNENQKLPELEAFIDAGHRYAKEVEHSDLNLNRLERLFREKEACRLESLLGVVLS